LKLKASGKSGRRCNLNRVTSLPNSRAYWHRTHAIRSFPALLSQVQSSPWLGEVTDARAPCTCDAVLLQLISPRERPRQMVTPGWTRRYGNRRRAEMGHERWNFSASLADPSLLVRAGTNHAMEPNRRTKSSFAVGVAIGAEHAYGLRHGTARSNAEASTTSPDRNRGKGKGKPTTCWYAPSGGELMGG
jgi:hypothetical protein